jgi:FkbH-like protein
MTERARTGLLVSDFQVGNLAALLGKGGEGPPMQIVQGPFGQVIPILMEPPVPPAPAESFDFAVVWAQPEAISSEYARAKVHHPVEAEAVRAEVRAFADRVRGALETIPNVLVCTFGADPADRGLGILDRGGGHGLARLRSEMNRTLADELGGVRGVLLLDSERWIARVGVGAYDPRLWYMAKIPFTPAVFQEAAVEIRTALHALRKGGRKLLILDLDHTLWGGVVGETGYKGVRLGGHDPLGEAFVDFQRAIEALTRRGVVLGIVSKNEEEVALEAIREHPEMVLRPEHFAGWRINWQDKAANVAALVEELNLGLGSAVFIDDQPAERARVREALPEVLVPEWPEDPTEYRRALRAMRCFDVPALSEEDRARARSYAEERQRREVRASVGSMEAWLEELGVRVEVEPLGEANLSRATQLLNKTNQMNLRTRRMSETEFARWAEGEGRQVWVCRVSDRFGEAGLTGLVSVELDGAEVHVADFILSCRVFGRRVEEAMVGVAAKWARRGGAERLVAEYLPTERNRPCLRFWEERSGFEVGAGGEGEAVRFERGLAEGYPMPESVEMVGGGQPAR